MERNRTKPQDTRRTKETCMKLEIKRIFNPSDNDKEFIYICTLDGRQIMIMDYFEPLSVKEILSNFYDYVGLNNETIKENYNKNIRKECVYMKGGLFRPYNMKTIYCEDIPNMEHLFRKSEYKNKVRIIKDMFQ